jgi:hypothetical protein
MNGKVCDVAWCPALSADDSVYCVVHKKYTKLRSGWGPEDSIKAERASQAAKRRAAQKEANRAAKNAADTKKRRGYQD